MTHATCLRGEEISVKDDYFQSKSSHVVHDKKNSCSSQYQSTELTTEKQVLLLQSTTESWQRQMYLTKRSCAAQMKHLKEDSDLVGWYFWCV